LVVSLGSSVATYDLRKHTLLGAKNMERVKNAKQGFSHVKSMRAFHTPQ